VLSGSGTIGGDVTVTGGSIALSPGGNILGAVTVDSGTLSVGVPSIGNCFSSSGGLNVTGGGVLLVSPSATIYGNVNISSSAQSNFSGNMSGTGSVLTLNAPSGGTLTLSNTASSTYGGVVVQGGTLRIATTAALGSNPLTVNGGTLDLGGWSSFTLTSLAGNGGIVDSSSGTLNLTVSPPGNVSTNYGGSISDGGGLVSLLKNGAGTLVLSGSNTYSGSTIVTGGTLVLGNAGAIPSGSNLMVGDAISFGAIVPDSSFAAPLTEAPMVASVSPVPEPATLAIVFAGAFALALVALRRRIGG
jgi:autotransporter-associated beta strand protein